MISFTKQLIKNIGKATLRRPRGFDILYDLRQVSDLRTVFDVGANIGQSARKYLANFTNAKVISFEPSADSYAALISNVRSSRFIAEHLALGESSGTVKLDVSNPTSEMYSISETGTEIIKITTLDSYCLEHSIEQIDFLKIDTEGHDLEVLRGASRMIAEKRIGAIQVEAGMNGRNTTHVPLSEFQEFLEERGFALYGIYDQVEEFICKEMHLRRSNPIFIPFGVPTPY